MTAQGVLNFAFPWHNLIHTSSWRHEQPLDKVATMQVGSTLAKMRLVACFRGTARLFKNGTIERHLILKAARFQTCSSYRNENFWWPFKPMAWRPTSRATVWKKLLCHLMWLMTCIAGIQSSLRTLLLCPSRKSRWENISSSWWSRIRSWIWQVRETEWSPGPKPSSVYLTTWPWICICSIHGMRLRVFKTLAAKH